MPTTKKRLKSGFAFGISNTSRRLLFPDQNFLNKGQFGTRIKGRQRVLGYKKVKGQNQGSATRLLKADHF